MLTRIDLRGRDLTPRELRGVVPRAALDVADAMGAVEPILAAVRERGEQALREFSERFDGVEPASLRVPTEELNDALNALDPVVLAALETAYRRVMRFHSATLPQPVSVQIAPGATVTQRWVPVGRVGLYVPGGLAVYPSSVVMNVVAAQAAGVESIAVASPPQREFGGLPHPVVLAACALLGVSEVYAVGGAQAVAMLAYGVEGLCEPVDVITGPGNVYVAAAKRAVNGTVGIDAEAGPTEIAVIADAGADPELVAADLVSQAEHDPLAGAVLITDDEPLADAVAEAVERRTAATKHAERVRQALGGAQSAIVLTGGLEQSLAVADAYGAEHLEVHTDAAAEVAARVRNAGAVFVGAFSPVSLGDYVAGSNHVLPTGGTARFASGLNVTSFLRAVSVVEYGRDALAEVADHVVALADAEELPAHGEAVRARFDG